jgi:PAS domain S-box-containing protein
MVLNARRMHDGGQTTQKILLAIEDITERSQLEQTMAYSELRYRRLFETAQDGILILNADTGEITDVNPFLCDMLGYSREDLLGKRLWELGFFGKIAASKRTFRKLQDEGYVRYEDLPLRTKDGRSAEVEFVSNAYPIDGEKVIQCNVRDITDRKRAEEALRETRDYLESLINSASVPIIVWNTRLRVTRFNRAFETLSGKLAKEILGKNLHTLFAREDRITLLHKIQKAAATKRPHSVEIPVMSTDGTTHVLLWNMANIYASDGKTRVATIAQGVDITEQKKSEQLKDEFIGMVSHEIRSPLTVIIGALSTASMSGLTEEERGGLLRDASGSAEALSRIVDNLLELSRYQANRLTIEPQPTDVRDIAGKVVRALEGFSAKHRLINDIPSVLGLIRVDPIRLERIVYNLVNNAIKYSPDGGAVSVFAREQDGELLIGVSDQGVGISAEDQHRLFNRFERLQTTAAKTVPGIGLGLRVCQILVAAHNGRMWVESEIGKGSTFLFTIPLESQAAKP